MIRARHTPLKIICFQWYNAHLISNRNITSITRENTRKPKITPNTNQPKDSESAMARIKNPHSTETGNTTIDLIKGSVIPNAIGFPAASVAHLRYTKTLITVKTRIAIKITQV